MKGGWAMDINILLFDDYETLDVFGPVEVFGNIGKSYSLRYLSLEGGLIRSRHGFLVHTDPLQEFVEDGILFIPGGYGTRVLVSDGDYINMVRDLASRSRYCLTVCTGSAILAKTGLLKGLKATSNKISFDWVKTIDHEVLWIKRARWVADEKFWTSSGVSAGIDMALGFVEMINGRGKALEAAHFMEYMWNENMQEDPFSAI
jgi:putative intracellular protease/amidase